MKFQTARIKTFKEGFRYLLLRELQLKFKEFSLNTTVTWTVSVPKNGGIDTSLLKAKSRVNVATLCCANNRRCQSSRGEAAELYFFPRDISMIIRQKVLHSLVEAFDKTTESLSPILLSTVLTIVLPQIISALPKYLTH